MVAEDRNLSVVPVAVGEIVDDRYGDVRTLVTETSLTTFHPTIITELLFSILKDQFLVVLGALIRCISKSGAHLLSDSSFYGTLSPLGNLFSVREGSALRS